MSWTELAGGVKDFGKEAVNVFKDTIGANVAYPYLSGTGMYQTISEIDTKNWNKNLSYGLSVVYSDDPYSSYSLLNFNIPGFVFSEFKFDINPQELRQDEKFSITITPTQNGVVSEHNGIILRDLVLSGTTGVHPLKGSAGATSKGKAIFNSSAKSGYYKFLEMRNYIRAYAEIKANYIHSKAILTFINRKDNERLVVEPDTFSMIRSKDKGQLYTYNIVFKIIGNLAPIEEEGISGFFKTLDDALDKVNEVLDTGRGILAKASDLLRQVEREINNTLYEPLRKFALLVKTAIGIKTQLCDMSSNFLNKFSNSDVFRTLIGGDVAKNPKKQSELGSKALSSLSYEQQSKIDINEETLPPNLALELTKEKEALTNLKRSFFEDLREEVVRIRDNASELFGLGNEDYNTYAGRTETFIPSEIKQTTNEEYEIIFGFSQAIQALDLVLAYGDSIFSKDPQESYDEVTNNFNNSVQISKPSSVDEAIIPPEYTLEDIAAKYLGDYSRWTEIAVLNNLIPPYIQETSTSSRIKQYGDRILIPKDSGSEISNVRITKVTKYNQNLTETENRLGVDLKLGSNFDFVMTTANDFDLSYGFNNAYQAIKIKMNLSKGDLRDHPTLGISLIIGEKNVDLDLLYDMITGEILKDSRFSDISNFTLAVDGSSVIIRMNLKIREFTTPVPLTLGI